MSRLDELAVRHLDRRYPPPGHPNYREPDISVDEWREAYFALAAVALRQLDECRASLAQPEPLDLETLTDWLIEDVTASRKLREGNPVESREAFRFVAMRLLTRLRALPPPGFVKATTIETLTRELADCHESAVAAERERIIDELGGHLSLSAHPTFAHFDYYGVGQVVQGKPWPEGR